MLRSVIQTAFFTMLLMAVNAPVIKAQNYAEYDRLLRAEVDARGLVNYAGLKKEIGALKGFVDQLGAADPLAINDSGERLRYYLTAYNAWVLYYATNAYPSKSEMWNFVGLFRDHDIVMGGDGRLQLSVAASERLQSALDEFAPPA